MKIRTCITVVLAMCLMALSAFASSGSLPAQPQVTRLAPLTASAQAPRKVALSAPEREKYEQKQLQPKATQQRAGADGDKTTWIIIGVVVVVAVIAIAASGGGGGGGGGY